MKVFQTLLNQSRKIEWLLLLFLLLIINVKLVVKIPVLLLFIIIFRKKLLQTDLFRQKFVWFYLSMIIIGIINLLINIYHASFNYFFITTTGGVFWILCIMAAAVNYYFTKRTDHTKLHNTASLFFILNATFTLFQLIIFMLDAGTLNPYTYQGMNQKYFISTGDLLRGLSFDVSTTNALINAMAVFYFFDRRKFISLLLCMIALLATASNFTNVLVLFIFVFLFIFQSDRIQKSLTIICICLFGLFIAKVSPQNQHYIKYVWQKLSGSKIDTLYSVVTPPLLTTFPDSMLTEENRKRKFAMNYLDSIYLDQLNQNPSVSSSDKNKDIVSDSTSLQIKPEIPKPNIHSEPYQRKKDTSLFRKKLIDFAVHNIPAFDTSLENTRKKKLPGKLIALKQSAFFFKDHPNKILTGAGMGQFSSKLAFRATGLKFAGSYPQKFVYINKDFRDNHLNLYLNYFTKDAEVHSLMNTPDSVYDQLLAEYGIAGLICFFFLYAWYFIKTRKKKSYGLPMLMLLTGALFIGYWFEQLSVIIIFELLMFINIKEVETNKAL